MGRPSLPIKRFTIAPSAARAATASFTGTDIHNAGYGTAHVYLDVTLDPAAAAITLKIQGKDSLSGDYFDLLSGSAVSAVTVGPNRYSVGTGVLTVANVSLNYALPKIWRVVVTGADTDSMTYSISAEMLPY